MKTQHRNGAKERTARRPLFGTLFSLGWLGVSIFATVCLAGVSPSSAWAQTQSGLSTIQGTVTDSTGAVIRGAGVHVVASATGVVSDTKSNGAGFFQVPGLVVGNYVVTFSAPNMSDRVYNVELHSAQTAVLNPFMTAGSVTQKVEVTGTVVQITNPDSPELSSTLENERINQLPMNGRNVTALAQETTPGLEKGFGPGSRANGLAGEGIEYVADGAPLDNRNFGGPNASSQAQFPDADAVQEVKVDVSNGGAQYSTPATGIITTKSGTNHLHGSLFWTGMNNSVVGIARGRQDRSGLPAPNYKRNEFGISAGGPVEIPHVYHGRDKTFWFFAYERYSLVQTMNKLYSVDTPAMAQGDFSGLSQVQLYDPSTTAPNPACPVPGRVNGTGPIVWNGGGVTNNPYCRQPFGNGIMGDPGNNKIPTKANAVAQVMYAMTPKPTLPDVTDPTAAANYIWPGPNLYTIPTITWRLDHNFTENDKAYLRYTSNQESSQYPGGVATTLAANGLPGKPPIPAMAGASETVLPVVNFATALGYTHIFSPTFFSETIVSQQWFSQFVTTTGNPHHNYEQELGLQNNFGETGFPAINGFVMLRNGNQYDYGLSQIITNIDENLTKMEGKHQLLFGARYRHERLGYQPDQGQDQVVADNLSTALYDPNTKQNYGAAAQTGSSAADAYLGSMYSFSAGILPPYTHYHDQEFDAYFQDNFHVFRNLTLNMGLRWEDHPALAQGGFGAGFDMPHHAIVLENTPSYYISKGLTTQAIITNMQNIGVKFETPSQAGYSDGQVLKNYPFTFGPRFGFAWQPFGVQRGTVLRGGYGRYIFPEAIRNLITGRNLPFFTSYSYNNNSAAQDPDSTPNYELRNPQNLFLGQNTANIVNSSGTTAILPGFGGTFLDHNFAPEMATEANVTLEQSFRDSSALRISWQYTHAQNLTRAFLPNAGMGAFNWEYTTGTVPPTGGASTIGTSQYATTALNPYDNTTYGNFYLLHRTGWSNDNSLQVNYQRLFHHGVAFQAIYVWSRPFRIGSNSTRDGVGSTTQVIPGVRAPVSGATYGPLAGEGPMITPNLPPALPPGAPSWADSHDLVRFQSYRVDPYFSGLFHHITLTGLVDLPFGRNKRFFSNTNRLVDGIIGGWQIAGDAQVQSQNFSPGIGYWGQTSPLKTYKHAVPITDCSSGKCFNRYMWFNGYVSPKFLPAANGGICTANCVTGLPADYKPYQAPINNNPNIAANFGTNNVGLTVPGLNGGQQITVPFITTYAGDNHPYMKSVLNGPFNYNVDLSIFKVIPITEKTNLRVNLDAFNALNIMGYNNPNGTSGEESVTPGGSDGSSYWTPRQLQLTIRYTF